MTPHQSLNTLPTLGYLELLGLSGLPPVLQLHLDMSYSQHYGQKEFIQDRTRVLYRDYTNASTRVLI